MAGEGVRALECCDVTVNFGDVVALLNVSVAFERRRIHAVVGQNGAGKTTFARVCAGIVRPSAGSLRVDGRNVPTGNVNLARAAGVELVHQSFALPPSFTVAEAMEFGSRRRNGWVFTRKALEARWQAHLDSFGVRVRMGDRVRDLPVETQQGVEIARALVTDAKLLILDEPTSVLSPSAIETLFERLRRLQQSGVTILLILHKIREVLAIAETVTVLRGGRLIEGPRPADSIDPAQLASAIIGAVGEVSGSDHAALVGAAEVTQAAAARAATRKAAPPVLAMKAVSTRPDGEGPALDVVDLTVGKGEIVGIAGIEGNGQRQLVRAIAGLVVLRGGAITLNDRDVTQESLLARRASGLRIIPFERYTEGLSLSSKLWENWSARLLVLGHALKFINPDRLRQASRAAFEQWDVRFASVDQPASSLSGGNAQKVILSREIDDDASLIIAAQPTRGLDVGATAFVWRSLRGARERGHGVLMISSDLDELFEISDRIIVMLSGRVAGVFAPPYDLQAIGAAMTGVRQ